MLYAYVPVINAIENFHDSRRNRRLCKSPSIVDEDEFRADSRVILFSRILFHSQSLSRSRDFLSTLACRNPNIGLPAADAAVEVDATVLRTAGARTAAGLLDRRRLRLRRWGWSVCLREWQDSDVGCGRGGSRRKSPSWAQCCGTGGGGPAATGKSSWVTS